MYYNYHARNMERIRNGELLSYEFTDGGKFALILNFNTYPYKRPIREYALWKYEEILKEFSNAT